MNPSSQVLHAPHPPLRCSALDKSNIHYTKHPSHKRTEKTFSVGILVHSAPLTCLIQRAGDGLFTDSPVVAQQQEWMVELTLPPAGDANILQSWFTGLIFVTCYSRIETHEVTHCVFGTDTAVCGFLSQTLWVRAVRDHQCSLMRNMASVWMTMYFNNCQYAHLSDSALLYGLAAVFALSAFQSWSIFQSEITLFEPVFNRSVGEGDDIFY